MGPNFLLFDLGICVIEKYNCVFEILTWGIQGKMIYGYSKRTDFYLSYLKNEFANSYKQNDSNFKTNAKIFNSYKHVMFCQKGHMNEKLKKLYASKS